MTINPLPTIRKRQASKLANTNYVNELADVVAGQSPFGTSGQTGFHPPPWMMGYPLRRGLSVGYGQYEVTILEWLPEKFQVGSAEQLSLVELTRETQFTGYLINQAENDIATNLVDDSEILIGSLLFIHQDSKRPVFGTNRSTHVLHWIRQNPATFNFEYSTFNTDTEAHVPPLEWHIWANAVVCEATPTATLMMLMDPGIV